MSIYSDAYHKFLNLRLASDYLGMKLPTLYWHLKKEGVAITGNKSSYGSASDKFGAKAEQLFSQLVPAATNNNMHAFQPKVDFSYCGLGIEVKGSNLDISNKRYAAKRWAFSFKQQESIADFFVCIGYEDNKDTLFLIIPGDLVRFYQSISISQKGSSKWRDYEVTKEELIEFFNQTIACEEDETDQLFEGKS